MKASNPAMESKPTSLLTVLSIVITTVVAAYLFTGPGYAIELTAVSLLALGGWLRFSFRDLPSQDHIVAPYVLIIVLCLALNTSRFWSDYSSFLATHWPAFFAPSFTLTHIGWFLLFVTVPVSVMLLGGYYVSKRIPIGFYMAWWAFLYGIAESLIQYKVEFGLAEGYSHRYFTGTVAAIALLIVGVTGCQRLLQKHLAARSSIRQPSASTNRQVNLWTTLLVSLIALYAVSLYLQAGFLSPASIICWPWLGWEPGAHNSASALYSTCQRRLLPRCCSVAWWALTIS